jgi:ubiquinone/menaquinone biosynthesis C-methylase UbiE
LKYRIDDRSKRYAAETTQLCKHIEKTGVPMPIADPYRVTHQLDNSTLDALAARLEARGKHPRFIEMMQQYLDAMEIDSAGTVIDLGCGTGVAARTIAHRPCFRGRITGIDRSAYLTAFATRFAHEEGVAAKVEFRAGDSHSLSIADASFDAAVAHTLISHVEDPLAVVKEIARIVKPGGRIAIFDGDYATLTFGSADPARSQAMDALIIEALITNPRAVREMPKIIREAGLTLNASFANVVADIGKADFFAPGLESLLKLLPKSGAMSESDTRAWVDALRKRSDEGTYFGASNFYAFVAARA